MAGRPEKKRRVELMPEYTGFAPEGICCSCRWRVALTTDELEVLRLLDLEGLDQKEAAERLGVARTTVANIARSAHRKVADALVNGKRLEIVEGPVSYAPAPSAGWARKEGSAMRVAATYENGMIFPHFGRTTQFKLYDIEDGKVASSEVVGTNGASHGALAGLLAQGGVDALICGGIGGGALRALSQLGITVYPGVAGSADAAVAGLLNGTLMQSADPTCGCHHEEGHGCGSEEKDGCCH